MIQYNTNLQYNNIWNRASKSQVKNMLGSYNWHGYNLACLFLFRYKHKLSLLSCLSDFVTGSAVCDSM